MFGVIPKPLWEKKIAAGRAQSHPAGDELPAGSHGGKMILVETGAGEKMRRQAARTFTRWKARTCWTGSRRTA